MPNQSPKMIKERILNFSIAHPGLGPKRGGIVVSPNGVWKVLCRHGLNTRIKRLAPSPATRLPMRESRDPGPERHSTSPGRASWSESTASSSGAYGGLRARSGSSPRSISPPPTPGPSWWSARPASPPPPKLARRVTENLREAGWRLERLLPYNGNEFKGFTKTVDRLKVRHTRIHAGCPQTRQRRGAAQNDPRRLQLSGNSRCTGSPLPYLIPGISRVAFSG